MSRSAMIVVLMAFMFPLLSARAEIQVPAGFVVDTLLDQIDGTTPRLEAIRNPDYGFGVIAASVDNGILKVLRISESSVELLATMSDFPPLSRVWAIRFDTTGLFANELYVNVFLDFDGIGYRERTHIFRVSATGTISLVAAAGTNNDVLQFDLAFTTGAAGYTPGAYLEDAGGGGGTSLYHMAPEPGFELTRLAQNLLPPSRTDLDVYGMEFDPTGVYGSYLTMADSDPNNDDLTVVYQLLPDLSWVELTTPVATATRSYRDMAFSPGGAFGQMLYVTDIITDTLMAVDAAGEHTPFASGFLGVRSVTVREDGEHMFVSDANGVYRIRADTTIPGPHLVMREPWVEADDVHTGPSGVDSLRLLWSERVLFDNSNVTIINEDAGPVPFSVSGSNSQFMIIAFGEVLLNNEYTITISDSVVSAVTGSAIDGDNDGTAGGAAVLVMKHRHTHDSDRDGDIDLNDFATFAVSFTG